MSTKFEPPAGPPPSYGADGSGAINSPAPAHVQPQGPQSEYYAASPYQGGGYPPQNNYPQQQNGYYAPGPQMYQQPQGYYPPGQQQGMAYGPQGGYAPGYGPQGGYYDNRRGGATDGFMGALLASLACCCCVDACLFF